MSHAVQFELRLARRMARLGTETAFEVLNRARELERQGKDIIHLEIGEPDFDTPDNIIQSAVSALNAGWTHYGPSAGLPDLRKAVADEVSHSRGRVPKSALRRDDLIKPPTSRCRVGDGDYGAIPHHIRQRGPGAGGQIGAVKNAVLNARLRREREHDVAACAFSSEIDPRGRHEHEVVGVAVSGRR